MVALDIFHLLFRCVSVEELIIPPDVVSHILAAWKRKKPKANVEYVDGIK